MPILMNITYYTGFPPDVRLGRVVNLPSFRTARGHLILSADGARGQHAPVPRIDQESAEQV